jgi:hypothetical protein
MSDETIAPLLRALGIAAFERRDDGRFVALAEPPAWLPGLTSDGTFPFLGHVLEEAVAFWGSGADGCRDWGPCAEVDAGGREFHVLVTACTSARTQYLVIRLDEGSDRVRAVLQQVRERALEAEGEARQRDEGARGVAGEIQRIVGRLLASGLTPAQVGMLTELAARCDELARRAAGRTSAST